MPPDGWKRQSVFSKQPTQDSYIWGALNEFMEIVVILSNIQPKGWTERKQTLIKVENIMDEDKTGTKEATNKLGIATRQYVKNKLDIQGENVL